jgi:hypothetical protein
MHGCGSGSAWIPNSAFFSGSWIRIHIRVKSWFRINIKTKIQETIGSKCSHSGPWTLIGEAWRIKMLPWRVCRPVVADSHNFDEQQDPDPHKSETYESGSAFRWCGSTLHSPDCMSSRALLLVCEMSVLCGCVELVLSLESMLSIDFMLIFY